MDVCTICIYQIDNYGIRAVESNLIKGLRVMIWSKLSVRMSVCG